MTNNYTSLITFHEHVFDCSKYIGSKDVWLARPVEKALLGDIVHNIISLCEYYLASGRTLDLSKEDLSGPPEHSGLDLQHNRTVFAITVKVQRDPNAQPKLERKFSIFSPDKDIARILENIIMQTSVYERRKKVLELAEKSDYSQAIQELNFKFSA